MKTIRANVDPRLLSKASRLFTGTLAGRIIEILQNARRAGAKHVRINNHEGTGTVPDNKPLCHRLIECFLDLKRWRSATILADGQVTLQLSDGSQKTLLPPQPAASQEVPS